MIQSPMEATENPWPPAKRRALANYAGSGAQYYSGFVITPQAMRGGAPEEVPPATA